MLSFVFKQGHISFVFKHPRKKKKTGLGIIPKDDKILYSGFFSSSAAAALWFLLVHVIDWHFQDREGNWSAYAR